MSDKKAVKPESKPAAPPPGDFPLPDLGVFARNLVEKLDGSVKMHKIPLRSAGFRVLTAPDVPSVLIELGYMSSPKDAELLNSPAWREQAVAAVHQAIEHYFESARPGEKAAASAR